MLRIFRTRDYDPDPDRDLGDEIQAHLELLVEDLMAGGMAEVEARAEAARRLGDGAEILAAAAPHTRTRLRRRTLLDRFDTLIQDVRYAMRRMARSPGFTAVAILSLAIGIGANTAVFSVVNAFLIRTLPFRAPEELVRVYTGYPGGSPYMSTAYPDILDMGEMDDVFAGVGAAELLMAVATPGDEPRRVLVEALSVNLLPLLGVEPVLGRRFLPEEDGTPGESPVAILGHGFWQQAFGGDPGVVGRTLTVAGTPFTVVGVAPEWFACTQFAGIRMDLFVPVSMATVLAGDSNASYRRRDISRFEVWARLAPGATIQEAKARLDVLASQLQEAFPETNRNKAFRVYPAQDVAVSPELNQPMQLVAGFLLVVVGLVLLLACTNLASFLLARGVERQREVAMRLALGAGRGRLIQQLLTETLLLGLLGGMAGLVLARLVLSFAVAYQPPIPISLTLDLSLDPRVLWFTLGVSSLAGLLLGMAPAHQSTRPELVSALKEGGGSGVRKRLNLQSGLVALQVTVSMILLVGAGLFLRSLLSAQRTDPGFSTEEAGIAWLDLSGSRLPQEDWNLIRVELEEKLRAEPGVRMVTSAGRLPLSLGNSYQDFRIPGVEPPQQQAGHRMTSTEVSAGYFEAMKIPLLSGREFSAEDGVEAPRVVVVNRAMADRFWPGEDPVGKEIFQASSDSPWTVVGVAGDVKLHSMGEAPAPFVYFPMAQRPPHNLQLLIRGTRPQRELVAVLHRVIREVNPNLLVMEVKTMGQHLELPLFGPRAAGALLGSFGFLALLLSSMGLYGVVSFSVSRRAREVGIRMSLGARTGQVVGLVVGRTLAVVAVGGLAGLAIAIVLARVIRFFLVGVSPADPLTLVGIPLLLGGIAVTAALIPARRATRVNPVEALRSD